MYDQFGNQDKSNQTTNPLGALDPQPVPQAPPGTPPDPSQNPNDPANIPPSVQQFGGVGYKLDNVSQGHTIHALTTPTPQPDATTGVVAPQTGTNNVQAAYDQQQADDKLKELQKQLKSAKKDKSLPAGLAKQISQITKKGATAPGKLLQGIQSTLSSLSGSFTTGDGMRTDRHNNLIAAAVGMNGKNQFTAALDKAGIKWTFGDPFPNDPNMRTIKIEGDPLEGARAILSQTNAIQGWYVNHTGQKAAQLYGVYSNNDFNKLSPEQQNAYITSIYQSEGGNGSLIKR